MNRGRLREQVRRDTHGIPFLTAPDPLSLARLQGRVTAQDRAWQLELDRRRGEGRTAEWLGADAVGWDVFARRVRLADTARRCFAHLDDEHRAWVTAYADGVGEGLAEASSHEFDLLGVRPESWQPWHPVLALLVQHVFGSGFPVKLWRAWAEQNGVADRFGSAAAPAGSNAWAVTAERSTTGAPLIAADPHRLLEWPGIYQQIGLRCPEFDVIGLAFPGVPGTPHFGHSGHVAWAITSAVADDRDLYAETLPPTEPVIAYTEEVLVRNAPARTVTVLETARGPVLDPDSADPVSLRTPVRVLGDCGLNASLPLLRARDAWAAAAAWDHWVEPVNRVLIADRERVLERYAGRVPVRDLRRARRPWPAGDRAGCWRGWVDFEVTEVTGAAVHANQPASPALTADPAPADRAVRIGALLGPRVSAADCARTQTDVASAEAGVLLELLTPAEGLGPAAAGVWAMLAGWDRRMTASSVAAGWYARWRHALVTELLAEPELAPLADGPQVDPVFTPWCSTRAWVGTSLVRLVDSGGVPGIAGAARRALERIAGQPPVVWGGSHRLQPWHELAHGGDPLLTTACERLTVPVDGDTETVLATTSLPGVSDRCVRVPVARVIWDLADRSRSQWVVPLGAAGDPAHPHAFDQFPTWLDGALHRCDHPHIPHEETTDDRDLEPTGRS
jgi:penicillin amidase